MFVLKKTYEALQLEWAKIKYKCEVLSSKVENLISELNTVYDNLCKLETENNNMQRYIEYVEKERTLSKLSSFMAYKDFVHTRVNVPKKVIPPVYKNSDVLPFTNYTSPSSSVGYIDFTLEKSGNYIHLEQITNNVSECKEDKTKNSRVDIVYTDYESKCKIEDTNSYPSYSNSSDDSSSSSSSSYSSSD